MSGAFGGTISVLWFLVSLVAVVYFIIKKQPVWKKWAVSLVLAFSLFCWSVSQSPKLEQPAQQEAKQEHDAISAYVMAQDFVSNQLKAPSTAKFPTYSKNYVTDLGEGKYTITAYVDAQNSFGAMMRNNFICTVHYVGNNKWACDNLEMR